MITYTCDKPMAAKRGLTSCTESAKCKTCQCCIIDDGLNRYHYTEDYYPPVKRTRGKAGVPKKPLKKWTEEESITLKTLHSEGLTKEEIADKMERSTSAIYARLKRMGLIPRTRRTVKGG